MKRIFSLTALLLCALFLGGCMVLETGPCHGYGCPAGTTGGAYEVGAPANAPSPSSSATSSAATRSTPDGNSNAHADK